MNLLIDKTELALLLEKKRDYIGNKVARDTVFAGLAFMLSVVTASYGDGFIFSGIVWKTIFVIVGIWYLFKIVKDIYVSVKDKFDHNILEKEIEQLNKIQHEHSLVMIKSSEEKFLLYDDERWGCRLFPNFKTQKGNNERYILDRLSAEFDIDQTDLSIRYIASDIQEKYSVSHEEYRVYNHRLYGVELKRVPEIMKSSEFVLGDRHYYWMTLKEMESDKDITKKNLDVVNFVKTYKDN